jgi:prolyl 4-hydroxylase
MDGSRLSRLYLDDEIFVVDGFLSDSDREAILDELDVALWRTSLTYQRQEDHTYRDVLSDMRASETAHHDFFGDALVEQLDALDARLEQEFGFDRVDLEHWQATRYGPGGSFDYHLDAGYWSDHYAGERILTFLVYLEAPESGGETHFRARDVVVQPRPGRLLVWRNLFEDGRANHQMIHSGTPVVAGRKTTLVTWQRQKRFRGPGGGKAERELVNHG